MLTALFILRFFMDFDYSKIFFCVGIIATLSLLILISKDKVIRRKNKKIQPKSLLTKTEIEYYYIIRDYLPSKYHLCPQVSFNAIITAKDIGIRNTFNRKYCDMTVCNSNFEVLAVIEIDDDSHTSAKIKESDAYRDKILKEAGFITLRFSDKTPKSEIKRTIRKVF